MSQRRSKQEATKLAEAYGIPTARAEEALAQDASRPSVPAGEMPEDSAGVQPTPTVDAADRGPQATSTQLAVFYCLSRDQMEAELIRMGLRCPSHDGATLYAVGEVARRLAEEDNARIAAAAELTDSFANDSLVKQAVQEVIAETRAKWLIDCDLHGELAALKAGMLAKLKKTHGYQQSKRAGDIWQELAVIEEFGRALLDAISDRRQPKTETRGNIDV